jgi:DNA-binding NarL/FixJ family response regulator
LLDLFADGWIDECFKALFHLFSEFKAIEVEAADGNSAIETTIHLLPEVVIMDVKMPGLNGVEATRRIKRATPDIHVIGISSQNDRVTRESMTNAGCSAFVIKECAHTIPDVIAKLTGKLIAKLHSCHFLPQGLVHSTFVSASIRVECLNTTNPYRAHACEALLQISELSREEAEVSTILPFLFIL